VIVVHPQVQAKTLQEFIALAKSQPGKLNYASPARVRPITWLASCSKPWRAIDVVHVPYRNSGEARQRSDRRSVQMMIDAVPGDGAKRY